MKCQSMLLQAKKANSNKSEFPMSDKDSPPINGMDEYNIDGSTYSSSCFSRSS